MRYKGRKVVILQQMSMTLESITSSSIRSLRDNTLSRVRLLLSPLCEGISSDISPSATDINAATESMMMCDDLLRELISRSSEASLKSKDWLHGDDWETFQEGLNDCVAKAQRQCHDGADASSSRREAVEKMAKIAKRLGETAEKLSMLTRKNYSKAHKLFKSKSVLDMYVDIGKGLYSNFIFGRNLKHKQEMVLLAVMYEVIREQQKAENTFFGPEFDQFLYYSCGIHYNNSDSPRGRYRQVSDVWRKTFADPTSKSKLAEYQHMKSYIIEKLSGGRIRLSRDAVMPIGFRMNLTKR